MHRTHTTADLIYVVAKPPAISARTNNQFVMIAAAITVKVRCKLDLKAFEVQSFAYS
jgi:hypothetical protein